MPTTMAGLVTLQGSQIGPPSVASSDPRFNTVVPMFARALRLANFPTGTAPALLTVMGELFASFEHSLPHDYAGQIDSALDQVVRLVPSPRRKAGPADGLGGLWHVQQEFGDKTFADCSHQLCVDRAEFHFKPTRGTSDGEPPDVLHAIGATFGTIQGEVLAGGKGRAALTPPMIVLVGAEPVVRRISEALDRLAQTHGLGQWKWEVRS